jgi:hypothetical protein
MTDASHDKRITPPPIASGDDSLIFETLKVRRDGGVLFVHIAAPRRLTEGSTRHAGPTHSAA